MIKLNDDLQIPEIGFGAMIYSDNAAQRAVSLALKNGYRLIDTAETYGTEKGVGDAINNSGIPRDEIFLTTKLWPNARTNYKSTVSQFKKSLRRLQQDYVDLYLIHEPYGDINEEWRAMEDLQRDGLVKSIGVSNFNEENLTQLMTTAKVIPAVNQIESHPWYNENALVEYCLQRGIVPEAWSALAEGRNNIFNNPVLAAIANRHHKSVAQVILRWYVQRGLIPLAKSENESRIIENQDIFDFELSNEEIEQINQLDTGVSLYPGY